MSSSVSHRFLKCSIKWDVLTFCFSPVSASLLHSFYSLENTTLSLAYFYSRLLPARRYAPQFSNHGPAGPCLIAFLAPDAWGSWLCRNVRWWARYSPDGGGCSLALHGTRFWTCHWLLLPPLPHLCIFFLFLGNNDRALCISRCKRKRTKQGESDGRYKEGEKHGDQSHAVCMARAEGRAFFPNTHRGYAIEERTACAQQLAARWRSRRGQPVLPLLQHLQHQGSMQVSKQGPEYQDPWGKPASSACSTEMARDSGQEGCVARFPGSSCTAHRNGSALRSAVELDRLETQ